MDDNWINTLGKMTYGIYVLTTSYEKQINGMIASWVSQVSYDPPLVMIALHPNRYSHHLIQKSGSFALHLIHRNRKEFLTRFKKIVPEAKFDSIEWMRGKTGCPILKECLAYVECKVRTSLSPGNHTIFIGEVVDAQFFSNAESLSTLDYDGIYTGQD